MHIIELYHHYHLQQFTIPCWMSTSSTHFHSYLFCATFTPHIFLISSTHITFTLLTFSWALIQNFFWSPFVYFSGYRLDHCHFNFLTLFIKSTILVILLKTLFVLFSIIILWKLFLRLTETETYVRTYFNKTG